MLINAEVSSIDDISTTTGCSSLRFSGVVVWEYRFESVETPAPVSAEGESSWNSRCFADLTEPRGGRISLASFGWSRVVERVGDDQAIFAAIREGDWDWDWDFRCAPLRVVGELRPLEPPLLDGARRL